MTPHQWHLEVTESAKRQIRKLPQQDRKAIFRGIKQLLSVENPTAIVGVKKLVGPEFEGLWRKRQGKYRIKFFLEVGEVIHNKFTYKGTVIIESVLDRKDAY